MMHRSMFTDRRDAGRQLAAELREYADQPNVVVLGLPRGGVPVAFEVARTIGAPMDVFVVRKLGAPGHEELAMGAVASGGVRVMNPDVVGALRVTPEMVERVAAEETRELERRERAYRGVRALRPLAGATVILVDDGLATGATMAAAAGAARHEGAKSIVVAAPVMSQPALALMGRVADACAYVSTPEPFNSVGEWYRDFSQTTDAEVRELLGSGTPAPDMPATVEADGASADVTIPAGGVQLHGNLTIPRDARGIVVFVHGSGSSRMSPRNHAVARSLNEHGYATLLFDLLTPREEAIDRSSGAHRFDINMLASRLAAVTDWLSERGDTMGMPLAYFGASTGGAAALVAAAIHPERVRAVISRGGRPDLAGDALPRVVAPTLLIVGGDDTEVLALNRGARLRLYNADCELAIVPRASHLFEEAGALEKVAQMACAWLDRHLVLELAGHAGV